MLIGTTTTTMYCHKVLPHAVCAILAWPCMRAINHESCMQTVHIHFCNTPTFAATARGASGAGKTTLLNVLAGHATKGGATVSGSVAVNGEECHGEKMRQISGYVHQVREWAYVY